MYYIEELRDLNLNGNFVVEEIRKDKLAENIRTIMIRYLDKKAKKTTQNRRSKNDHDIARKLVSNHGYLQVNSRSAISFSGVRYYKLLIFTGIYVVVFL